MYGIDSSGSVASAPTPAALGSEQFFRDGVAGSFDGTLVTADWLNMVQGSLLDLLDDQAVAHSKTDFGGVTDAVSAMIAADTPAIVTSTVDAQALLANPIASTTVAGILEITTTAEANGNDNTRALSASAFGANLTRLSTTSGTWLLPGGVYLLQFANYTGLQDEDIGSLPTPFHATDAEEWFCVGGGIGNNHKGSHFTPLTESTWKFEWDATSGTTEAGILAIGRRP